MWQIDFSADTDLAPETVWAALRDLQTGAVGLGSGDQRRGSPATSRSVAPAPKTRRG